MAERPDFIALLLDSLKLDYKTGGVRRLFPFLLITSFIIGHYISFRIPATLSQDTVIKFIAALITAQGIILAMNMQTSGTILSNISEGDFSAYLRSVGLLNYYMFLVQLIQYVHLISLFLLLGAAIVLMFGSMISPLFFKITFGLALSAFLYALRWAWGSARLVRDLIHYRSEFQSLRQTLETATRGNHS